ncbi:MAG: hypothetical protein NWF13_03950 [Candidatus Bathyarchaeota archaeon]|nr:hypothetical protein [Candidatus Bathyarchaeota archaeon]
MGVYVGEGHGWEDHTVEGTSTAQDARARYRDRYLVITLKGLRFAEKWYPVEHVPSHIARLYQLLLKLIRVRGVMAVNPAKRMGYGENVIDQALSTGCIEIWGRPSRLPESVRDKILELIGEAPREIYA